MMEYSRLLKRGMSGDDVWTVKQYLFSQGYYPSRITAIKNRSFGGDTVTAVKAFQRVKGLAVDGIVGRLTWGAMFDADDEPEIPYVSADEYPLIGETARRAINTALQTVSSMRREMVLEALKYCLDPAVAAKNPSSLYIRGGNLYNKDLSLNVIDGKWLLSTYAKKYASYCTNGRLAMMQQAVISNPDITGADCSGGMIGLLRFFGLVRPNVDNTANGLLGSGFSTEIGVGETTPGDFCGKSGHIGLYVGGGYTAEWAGGEYGCQLSGKTTRKLWSFTKKKYVTLSKWTKWRRPKIYG